MSLEHLVFLLVHYKSDGTDVDNSETWINKFEAVAKLADWDADLKLDIFQLFLSGAASNWFCRKKPGMDWIAIKKEFVRTLAKQAQLKAKLYNKTAEIRFK